MRAVIQRVREARVVVEERVVGEIQHGLVVFVAVAPEDTPAQAEWLAEKIITLRVFSDADGKMNLSLLDVGGSLLIVSQFTLYGDCQKGRRPSFVKSASPAVAEPLYRHFVRACRVLGVATQEGIFAADMQVHLINDGPVTLILDT